MSTRIRVLATLALLCFAAGAFACAGGLAPTSDFYVADYANVLDSATKAQMQSLSVALANTPERAQIVVLTVSELGDTPPEEFGLSVLREWGIGDKEKNNGVLLWIAMDTRDFRIDVGYGLEGALPDAKCGRILDGAIDYLREGDYSGGMLAAYKAIFAEVAAEYDLDVEELSSGAVTTADYIREDIGDRVSSLVALILPFLFGGGFLAIIILSAIFRGPRGPRGGGWWGGWGGGSGGSGGGFRGGGGGFGGGGGGFGGFGGSGGGGGAGRKF